MYLYIPVNAVKREYIEGHGMTGGHTIMDTGARGKGTINKGRETVQIFTAKMEKKVDRFRYFGSCRLLEELFTLNSKDYSV